MDNLLRGSLSDLGIDMKSAKFGFALGCVVLLSVSCRTNSANSKLKDAEIMDPKSIPTLVCEKGDPSYFVMKDLTTEPDLKNYDFIKEDDVEPSIIPGAEMITRLDVCVDGETPILKRIVFGMADSADLVEVVPESKIVGLSEILFTDDYGTLEIAVPFVNYKGRFDDQKVASDEYLYIKGSSKDNSALVLVAQKKEGRFVTSKRFLKFATAGKFEYSEVKSGTSCDALANANGQFTLGTATFAWKGVAAFGTSGGAAPNLCSLTVTDKAKELGADAGKAVTVEFPLNGSDVYKFTSNHHSVCDSFVVKFPKAQYGVTASIQGFGGGVCPKVVEGAPAAGDTTKFRFQYGTKVVEGSAKCKHHTRDCK